VGSEEEMRNGEEWGGGGGGGWFRCWLSDVRENETKDKAGTSRPSRAGTWKSRDTPHLSSALVWTFDKVQQWSSLIALLLGRPMTFAARRAAHIINRYAGHSRTLNTMTEPLGNLDALTAALPAQPQPQSLSSGASPPPLLQPQPEAGPSRLRAADKWLKPHGPPVGVAFGARLLGEEEDVWSQNAWYVESS
jgi:hypothetical protein